MSCAARAAGASAIEILGVFASESHLNGSSWTLMANFNINVAGFCIAAMFIAAWATALLYGHDPTA